MNAISRALWRLMFGPVGKLLSYSFAGKAGSAVGGLLWFLRFRRSIAIKNLQLAFPEMSEDERMRIGRESSRNLFRVFFELITLRHRSQPQLREIVTVEDPEILTGIGEKGGLLLSAHFGNWELLAFGTAAIVGIPFSIIVKKQNDYGELDRMRTSRGNSVIYTERAAREATALFRNGGVVAMLADQSATTNDHNVQMFGLPTYSFSSPARFALKYRPTVIAGFAVRQPNGTYKVMLRCIGISDLVGTPEGEREFTQRYVALMEEFIRMYPEQWVWQHRKWKHTPGVSYK